MTANDVRARYRILELVVKFGIRNTHSSELVVGDDSFSLLTLWKICPLSPERQIFARLYSKMENHSEYVRVEYSTVHYSVEYSTATFLVDQVANLPVRFTSHIHEHVMISFLSRSRILLVQSDFCYIF
jgi:hypothetical protein